MPILEDAGKVSDTVGDTMLLHDSQDGESLVRNATSQPSSRNISTARSGPICAGCQDAIFDQYFLSISQEAWHCHCLKCSVCNALLDGQTICYYKDGMILCKDDYYKRGQKNRCNACNYVIRPDEFVMRTREYVFHISCFRCFSCTMTLHTGDQFGMRDDGSLYCQRHFQPADFPPHESYCAAGGGGILLPPNRRPILDLVHDQYGVVAAPPSPRTHPFTTNNDRLIPNAFYPLRIDETPSASCNGGRSKSRTRRKKSLHPFDDMTPLQQQQQQQQHHDSVGQDSSHEILRKPMQLEQCNSYTPALSPNTVLPSQTQTGQSHQTVFTSSSEESSPSRLTSSSPGGLQMVHVTHSRTDSSSPTNHQHQRTKRMRTSFKHQQLRSMKQYFSINHNPDAKDLKQLAQKTGLTKRVLQVWFQNARAKYRRSLLKQDPNRTMEGSPIAKAHSLTPRPSASPPSSIKNDIAHYPMSNGSNSQDTTNEYY